MKLLPIIFLFLLTCPVIGQNVPYAEIDLCQGNNYTGSKGFTIMYEFTPEKQGWIKHMEYLVNAYPMREWPSELRVTCYMYQGNGLFYDQIYATGWLAYPVNRLPDYKIHVEVWDRLLIKIEYVCNRPVAAPQSMITPCLPNGKVWGSPNGKHFYPLANYQLWMTYDPTL